MPLQRFANLILFPNSVFSPIHLGHTIVLCFQDHLVWNVALTNTIGHLDMMCFVDWWKPGTNKDDNHGHSTQRMGKMTRERFLTLDPASTVAVSGPYCPPNSSLYNSFIAMD